MKKLLLLSSFLGLFGLQLNASELSVLESLPDEINFKIMSNLPKKAFCALAQTSKYMHELAKTAISNRMFRQRALFKDSKNPKKLIFSDLGKSKLFDPKLAEHFYPEVFNTDEFNSLEKIDLSGHYMRKAFVKHMKKELKLEENEPEEVDEFFRILNEKKPFLKLSKDLCPVALNTQAFKELQKSKNLKVLYLFKEILSKKQLKELKEMLPNVKIHFAKKGYY